MVIILTETICVFVFCFLLLFFILFACVVCYCFWVVSLLFVCFALCFVMFLCRFISKFFFVIIVVVVVGGGGLFQQQQGIFCMYLNTENITQN